MIDAKLRPLIDPPLNLIARQLTKARITANQVTIAGFVTGIAAVPLIATHHEWLALLAIAVNRLSDGVDGAVARMRKLHTSARGKKSFYYLGGLTEGFETIVALALMCVFPEWFWVIALIFGMMCWVTTVTRIAWARQTL